MGSKKPQLHGKGALEKCPICGSRNLEPDVGDELLGLAFLYAARARDKGLCDSEVVWMVEQQLEHLDFINLLKRLDGEARA